MLKVAAEKSSIKAERLEVEALEKSIHRMRMEKSILMLLSRVKQKLSDKKLYKLQAEVAAERSHAAARLKALYYQLLQLGELEAQAVDAARERGDKHYESVDGTRAALVSYLQAEGRAHTTLGGN